MKMQITVERWDMARPVAVSRGSYSSSEIVVVELTDGRHVGRGECCPLAHYGHSAGSVRRALESMTPRLAELNRTTLLGAMPAGPARNALDCAMWDLEARRSGRSVWELAGRVRPPRQPTAMTLVMTSPEDMADQARQHAAFQNLKIKLGPSQAEAMVRAVRAARPDARLAVDANEAWTLAQLESLYPVFVEAGVTLIEQPLRAGQDHDLRQSHAPLPLCADESFHASDDLAVVASRYAVVNIKLDKCGGLTEALRILDQAPRHGLRCMVGCMFSTSLAIAPALVVASGCDYADLDGPMHFAQDRPAPLRCVAGAYQADSMSLWGMP